MLTMFTYALGGVDLDIMLGSSNPEASIFLSLIYQFAMGTVLMSLLTGAQGGGERGLARKATLIRRMQTMQVDSKPIFTVALDCCLASCSEGPLVKRCAC
jgi:hypothetical protein